MSEEASNEAKTDGAEPITIRVRDQVRNTFHCFVDAGVSLGLLLLLLQALECGCQRTVFAMLFLSLSLPFMPCPAIASALVAETTPGVHHDGALHENLGKTIFGAVASNSLALALTHRFIH
jgi:hypothetical protein